MAVPTQVHNKINVVEREKKTYWDHVRAHMAHHPALDEQDQNPTGQLHQPVGIFGDDAKYTLAGRKIIIMLLNFVLQKIESDLVVVSTLCNERLFWLGG